jgi:hypothetical protein
MARLSRWWAGAFGVHMGSIMHAVVHHAAAPIAVVAHA